MVLACDGVYDVFSNDELAMLLRAQIAEKHAECSTAENITHAIEDILNISLNRGSIDNMTIIVIVFENVFHERGTGSKFSKFLWAIDQPMQIFELNFKGRGPTVGLVPLKGCVG